jgi:cell wall assembly regulator SMI1
VEGLLERFKTSGPAPQHLVEEAESALGTPLPDDYKEFLRRHDGGEGFIGSHYLILWKSAQLKPFNDGYEFQKYAPALVAFGSDGGGDAFAFDTRTNPYPIVLVPFIGMSHEDAYSVASSFPELLQRMKDTPGSLF